MTRSERFLWVAQTFGRDDRERRRRHRNRVSSDRRRATRAPLFEPLESRLLLASVVLTPSKDNTLYSESGAVSNGMGQLYVGKRGGFVPGIRRAVLAFDLTGAGIPAGATVTDVSLELAISKAGQAAEDTDTMSLFKLTQDWGEGTSSAPGPGGRGTAATTNDATWQNTFFSTQTWTSPGGDFVTTASATGTVPRSGTASWSSAGMVADVQGWLTSPASSFGWIIRGDETIEDGQHARRFNSKDNGTAPQLTVTFNSPAGLTLAIAADSISEGAGAGATTGTVSRSGDTSGALTVNLASNDASEATVPASITIAAGQATSSPFNVDAVDDAVVDGTQTVTFTASASGLADSSDTVDVTDNDVASTVTSTVLNAGQPNRSGLASFMVQLSEAVTLGGSDALGLYDHTGGAAVSISGATLANNSSNSITWDMSGVTLPSGHISATLSKAAGLAETHTAVFPILPGDSTGDGQVGFADFGQLAAAFNAVAGAAYGPGDMNGDGNVNFTDFGILAGGFNAVLPLLELDFGDAGGSFPTILPSGARHILGSGLSLGPTVDGELDGQPDPAAAGDGPDDDGVTFATLQAGSTAAGITVNASVPQTALLNAWIDFNNDSDWNDPGEQIFVDRALSNGDNSLTVAIPASANAGSATARFRVSSVGGYGVSGLAVDGEVEDYLVTIVAAKGNSARQASVGSVQLAPAELLGQPTRVYPTTDEMQNTIGEPRKDAHGASAEVVDLAITGQSNSNARQPVASDPSWLDEDLVDQVHRDETSVLSRGLAEDLFDGP